MLIDFFLHLKAKKLPVSIREYLTLLEGLQRGVIGPSVDEFYHLSRACLVKDERNFDKFDRAFGEYFKGVQNVPGIDLDLPLEWLRRQLAREFTAEEKAAVEKLGGLDKLLERLRELLDWLKLLLAEDIAPEALRAQDAKAAIPPLHGALLKNEQDVHLFERLIFMARHNR